MLNRLTDETLKPILGRAEQDVGRALPFDDNARDTWPTATAARDLDFVEGVLDAVPLII